MNRVLITEPLRTREEFFAALGKMHFVGDSPAPRNLDGLADFVREFHVDVIVAADMALELHDYTELVRVLEAEGVKLVR